jgi:fructose-specific phosphotransferase system IIC component
MADQSGQKVAGILFIVAGAVLFAGAALGEMIAFYGIGASFVAIGAMYLGKSKNEN